MPKLDTTDRKILYELDLNARIPVSRIARKLRLSRDVVNYRLKKLEKDNVIRNYHAVVDVSRLGYKIFRVYLKFFSINSKDYKEMIDLLIKNESVFWAGDADGLYDLSFGIWVKSDLDFHVFYKGLIRKFRRYIKEDKITPVMHYIYLDRAYLTESKKQFRKENIIGGNEKTGFGDKDIKILQILSKNAREPLINIANKLNMDSSAIIYRIKQLEKKGIITGYKADINFHIIKRYFYSVKFYLHDFSRINEFVSYLKSLPFAVNFVEAIGSYDAEADLEVESEEEYFNFIRDVKDRFDFVSEILFFRTHKNYKILNMPAIS